MLDSASRYFHTVRYLKPGQILWRIAAKLKQKSGFQRLSKPPAGLRAELNSLVPFSQHDPWNSREQIRLGRFRFLNHEEDLGRPLNWKPTGSPLLWQFNLHYFNYLHLL